MKRRVFQIISALLLLVMLLTGCNDVAETSSDHKHDFSQKKETSEFLRSEATCTDFAEYYFSCSCGAKSENTFKGASKLAHDFSECVEDACPYKLSFFIFFLSLYSFSSHRLTSFEPRHYGGVFSFKKGTCGIFRKCLCFSFAIPSGRQAAYYLILDLT